MLDRLNPILRDDPEKWEDEDNWKQYVGQAKEPTDEEFAEFIADMACHDREGHIAMAMAFGLKTLAFELGGSAILAKPPRKGAPR